MLSKYTIILLLLWGSIHATAQEVHLKGYFKHLLSGSFGTVSIDINIYKGDVKLTQKWAFDNSITNRKPSSGTDQYIGKFNQYRNLYITKKESGEPSFILKRLDNHIFVGIQRGDGGKGRGPDEYDRYIFVLSTQPGLLNYEEMDFDIFSDLINSYWYEKETNRLIVLNEWADKVKANFQLGGSSTTGDCFFTSSDSCIFSKEADYSSIYNIRWIYTNDKSIFWKENKFGRFGHGLKKGESIPTTLSRIDNTEASRSPYSLEGDWKLISGNKNMKDVISFKKIYNNLYTNGYYWYPIATKNFISSQSGGRESYYIINIISKDSIEYIKEGRYDNNEYNEKGIYVKQIVNPNLTYSPQFYCFNDALNSRILYFTFIKNNTMLITDNYSPYPLSNGYIILNSPHEEYKKKYANMINYSIKEQSIYFEYKNRRYAGTIDSKHVLIINGAVCTKYDILLKNNICVSGDCINGYGVRLFKSGEIYEGNFKDGLFEGDGIFYWDWGYKWHDGMWSKGKQHGDGYQGSISYLERKSGKWANGIYGNATKAAVTEKGDYEIVKGKPVRIEKSQNYDYQFLHIDVVDGGILGANVCEKGYVVSYTSSYGIVRNKTSPYEDGSPLYKTKDLPVTVLINYDRNENCIGESKMIEVKFNQIGSYTIYID